MLKPQSYEKPTNGLQRAGHAPITGVPGVEISGQTRLKDLEGQYPYTDGFEESVIEAVRSGEIELFPIGQIVHVKHTSD
jgi:hypothetical protein